MIYVCVPVHNEARTAGLVLWKVRQVFTAFQREYQLLVCDDGSTDGTAAVLATYARVLPMTVVTHGERAGYARSLEELLRLALQRTDRPKRDCAIVIHGDFAHAPEAMEEMVKKLESGADLVVAEQLREIGPTPWSLRVARRLTPRLLPIAGVRDTVSGYLALRLTVLRQATRGDAPPGHSLLSTDGWCANAELLARLAPHARRVETVSAAARYDLHQRPSRVLPWQELVAAWRAGLDTLRGVETVHFVFRIVGGALWYHLDQTMESWVGKRDFRSRRFLQDTDERGRQWHRGYEIFPDSGFYREEGKDSTFPTVAEPLDDAAFLYWIRTVPLEQGKRYEYRRYFRPDRNPVIVTVVGHERVSVAGHKWNAIVVRPAIPNGRGIFAEKADARWESPGGRQW